MRVFFDKIRIRRERFTDALWGRWDRSLDAVGARWERFIDRVVDRRERIAEALWSGWDRSLGSVGTHWRAFTDRFRSRRQDGGGYRAERIGRGVGRRSWMIVSTSLGVVVMVTMAVVLLRDAVAPPVPPTSSEPSGAVGSVDVPDVRGMPASDARAELEGAGLEFAEPRAALGTPGLVLWTEPNIGRSVPPGTRVRIVIGVEAERLGSTRS